MDLQFAWVCLVRVYTPYNFELHSNGSGLKARARRHPIPLQTSVLRHQLRPSMARPFLSLNTYLYLTLSKISQSYLPMPRHSCKARPQRRLVGLLPPLLSGDCSS